MATPNHAVEGILFDCDGVLVDSFDAAALAWDSWAAVYAPNFDFRTQIAHGVRVAEMVATLVEPENLEAALADLDRREFDSASATLPIAGSVALTTILPRSKWAVVTSATRRIAHSRLTAAGHPLPQALVAAEDVDRGKPDPMPYLRGAEMLGLEPTKCVVFEDAPAGIHAARAAGVGLIVGVGGHLDGVTVDHRIRDLRSAQYKNGRLVLNGQYVEIISDENADRGDPTTTDDLGCATCKHDPDEHAGACQTDVYVARTWSKCECSAYHAPSMPRALAGADELTEPLT